jgi:hypothetical protein
MSLTYDTALWEGLYRHPIRRPGHPQFGQKVAGYSRELCAMMGDPHTTELDLWAKRWGLILANFPIGSTDRILVGGCAFGFLIEAAKDAGYPNIWGIDNSPHIEANGPTETRGDVLLVQDDFTGGGRVRAKLRTLTGDDEFDWIITEDMISSFDDAELPVVFGVCETALLPAVPLGHIIHITSTTPGGIGHASINWKTLAEWEALAPDHSWATPTFSEVLPGAGV